jgi:DNA primase
MTVNLEEVIKKIILSEVVCKYIKLIKKNTLYWGKCIFHKEDTPSFAVNNEKEYYHCFGCGAHGNVINFLMFVNNKTFLEVLEELCKTYNLPFKKNKDITVINNNTIEEILNFSLKHYESNLENNINVLDYLYKRGIDGSLIKKFRLGYSKENSLVIELMKKYSLKLIQEAGIGSMSTYDRLRNRIIFPIFNEKNQVIGFGGRTLKDEKPKYINSSESNHFHKNLSLYNINNIEYQVSVIYLVEGYMDVISMVANGYINTVGSMGTSVSKFQIFMILRRAKKIIIIFDGDEAGIKATERIINLILSMITPVYEIFICLLPLNEDPDSFLKQKRNFEEYTVSLMDFVKKKIIENKNLLKDKDLAEAFTKAEEYTNLIENINVKKSYKLLLESFIKDQLHIIKKQKNREEYISNNFQYKKIPKKINNNIYMSSREENIISIIITYNDLLNDFIEHLALIVFEDKDLEKIKNNIVLYYNTGNFNGIIEKYKNHEKVIKILQCNKLLLMKKDFCRKYLYDLLCLMPIDNLSLKFY